MITFSGSRGIKEKEFVVKYLALFCLFLSIPAEIVSPDWGFFAHRKINRFAVYTLPKPLFDFYKTHQAYLEKHAVDADKRRYASRWEAAFHYMDMDIYPDSIDLTDLASSRYMYSEIQISNSKGLLWKKHCGSKVEDVAIPDSVKSKLYRSLGRVVFETPATLAWESDNQAFEMLIVDSFSQHGLLPYRIISMHNKLVEAFTNKDEKAILRISADLGHYIGDANVPLHTTENYNGQLTGQLGIHAFWESRLPELFFQKKHYVNIRPATIIENVKEAIWQTIHRSHGFVDQVFHCQLTAKESVSAENVMCFSERNGQYVWQPCEEYADKYDQCMGTMVWDQWENAIQLLGSLWYTAWAMAGEPELNNVMRGIVPDTSKMEGVVSDSQNGAADCERQR